MKTFQYFQQSLGYLSIYPPQLEENNRFNSKNWLILNIYLVTIIVSGIFFVYEAKTLFEYSDSLYTCATAASTSVFFAVLVSNKSRIFVLIGKYEATIEKRE